MKYWFIWAFVRYLGIPQGPLLSDNAIFMTLNKKLFLLLIIGIMSLMGLFFSSFFLEIFDRLFCRIVLLCTGLIVIAIQNYD